MGNGEWGIGDQKCGMGNRQTPAAINCAGESLPPLPCSGAVSEHRSFIPHSPLRTGITLLEVLIAVAVLTIGLLSLASLIPIGKYQLSEATKFDRGSTIGRTAYRTLQVGQWLRPEMWLYAPSNGNVGTPVVAGEHASCRSRRAPASVNRRWFLWFSIR